MKPVDPKVSKELLLLGHKPVIQYAVEEGLHAEVDQIVVVLSPAKADVRRFLNTLKAPIAVVYQHVPDGEANAIAAAESVVSDRVTAIWYPDNVCFPGPGVLRFLFDVFDEQRRDVVALSTVTAANERTVAHAGKVKLKRLAPDLYLIRELLPKAAGYFRRDYPAELRACGIGIFASTIFAVIARARPSMRTGEFTDQPIRSLIIRERGLLGVRIPATVFDVGSPPGYHHCQERLARFQPDDYTDN